jgi:hypothetical protein
MSNIQGHFYTASTSVLRIMYIMLNNGYSAISLVQGLLAPPKFCQPPPKFLVTNTLKVCVPN